MLFGGLPVRGRRTRATELLERARALAMDPDIVLAEEPTGNLDTSSGTDIMSIFTDLWKQGRTLVIITHDPGLAKRASRIVKSPRWPRHR